MSLPRFWAFLAVALPVVAALVASLSTVDLTYQLRAGAEILASSSIPRVDSWTYTVAGQPWFDQQWGAQVAPVGGLPGRWLDRPGAASRRAGRGHRRLPVRRRPAGPASPTGAPAC